MKAIVFLTPLLIVLVHQTPASSGQVPPQHASTNPTIPSETPKLDNPPTPKPENPQVPRALLSVDTPLQGLQIERCVPLRPRLVFGLIPWFRARLICEPPRALGSFSERVFDKNRAGPLERVSTRLDTITKTAGGFDPNRSLTFTFNGQAVDLWTGGDPVKTTVPANTQANVAASIRDLQTGEYNVTFRFVSPSSADNDAEKVTLAILVKDEPWMPLIVILLGVSVSFLTKKIFVATKDRLAFRARISQSDTSWLRNEPPSSAVVWAQANLRLAKMWTRQAWLTVPDIVSARLADVEALMPTLRAIRDTRASLELSVSDQLALARSLGKLQVLTARCSNPPLTAATKQQIADELAGMDAWSRSDQRAAALWKDRLPSISALVKNINAALIVSANAQAVVTNLITDLNAAVGLGTTPSNVYAVYEKFAALEVFWEHRTETALLDKMAAEYTSSQSVRKLFKISDEDSWARLKAAASIEIVAPTVPQQVYDPFTLRVRTSDADVNDSYLFRYKLRYKWNIKISSKKKVVELTPETLEPTVSQYAPQTGTVEATVMISYDSSDSLEVKTPAALKIEESDAIPLVGAIQRAEGWPLALAAVIAVLTGLSTQYFGNQTFGSPKDYLMLFFTGAAVDWAKNAVQPTPAPSPTPTTLSLPAQK